MAGKAHVFVFLICVPLLAVAGEQTIRVVDPADIPFVTWLVVTVLSLVGFLGSSAPMLAKWGDGTPLDRWTIVQGVTISLISGLIAFLGGLYAGAPSILNLIAVLLASYAGDAYLRPRLAKNNAAIDGKAGGGA